VLSCRLCLLPWKRELRLHIPAELSPSHHSAESSNHLRSSGITSQKAPLTLLEVLAREKWYYCNKIVCLSVCLSVFIAVRWTLNSFETVSFPLFSACVPLALFLKALQGDHGLLTDLQAGPRQGLLQLETGKGWQSAVAPEG